MSRPNAAHPVRDEMLAASPRDGADPISPAAPSETTWRAHLVWLRARLRGRFSADLADDLAQETYLRVVDREATASVENPRGLLMTVASNLARDTFRRDRVRADYVARASHTVAAAGLGGHTAEDDFEVREAIRCLPPKLREVLLLSKIGGLTNREIAQRYGLSVRAIDKRLQQAVTLFVARLRD
jgi:RNA polymerase sigma-70 factor (ECF subfamily)